MGKHSTDRRTADLLALLGRAVLLPWPSGSKGYNRKWKHLQFACMSDATHLARLRNAGNIGVALGKVSNGLVTVDLDDDSYADAFLAVNPVLANTLRTHGNRGCNIWLRCRGDYAPAQKLKSASQEKIGEWRADGNQTIIVGTHPKGMAYRLLVDKPVITVRYDEIIWPQSMVPPHATESKRIRGDRVIGEKDVVEVSAVAEVPVNECSEIQRFLDTDDVIAEIAPTEHQRNNASLFKLARLIRSYEGQIGQQASGAELQLAFERWADTARQYWRPELTRDDYYAEFLMAYSYAQVGLNENPLELAVSRATVDRLPAVPGFADRRIRLLVAICRELQIITGAKPFFLPTRKLGAILCAHWTRVASYLRALEVLGIIHLAPGEVRKRGGNRSPRYRYGVMTNTDY